MPSEDLRLRLRLTADRKGFVGEIRVAKRELDKLTGAAATGSTAAKRYSRSQREAATATRTAGRSFTEAHGRLARYAGGFAAIDVLRRGARLVVGYADANVDLGNRLRLVTGSERELAEVRGDLFDISQDTRSELGANAVLYGRIALATQRLGREEGEVLKVTRLLNQQVKIGGATTSEASAGLVQFAQGLASGRLQGDELRSVMENLQGVQQGLIVGFAELSRRGEIDFEVTRENIRDLAAEGVLSADLLLDAVLASADDTEMKWRDVAFGIGSAWVQVSNSLQDVVRRYQESSGAFEAVASRLEGIASAIDRIDGRSVRRVTRYFAVLAALLAGKVVVSLGLYIARTLAAAGASIRFSYQLGVNSVAVGAQRVALVAGARAAGVYSGAVSVASRTTKVFLTSLGPIGLAIVGVAAVVDLLVSSTRDLEDGLPGLAGGFDRWGEEIEETRQELQKLQTAGRGVVRLNLEGEIEQAADRLEDAQARLERTRSGLGNVFDDPSLTGFGVDPDEVTRARAAVDALEGELGELEGRLRNVDEALGDVAASAQAAFDPGLSSAALDAAIAAEGKRLSEANREAAKLLSEANREAAQIVASLRTEVEALTDEYEAEIQTIGRSSDYTDDQKRAYIGLLGVRQRVRLAAIAARKAEEDGTVATLNAAAALERLRGENARLEAGGHAALERIEREAERRKLLNSLVQEYPNAAPDVLEALYSETLARWDLTASLDAEAAARQEILDRAADGLKLLPDLYEDNIAYTASVSKLDKALGLTGESLRNITGGLGQFAAASGQAFRLHKAAALATAIVSTAEAVARALADKATFGVAGRFALAAAVAAAGALQIAAIQRQQPPQAFRYGGVIDRRTEFDFGGGRRGLAGEAGPEAIIPLARGPAGLGIRNYGGGGRGNRTVHMGDIHVSVTVPQGGDERTGELFGRAASYEINLRLKPLIHEALMEEQRPGGALNRTDLVGV